MKAPVDELTTIRRVMTILEPLDPAALERVLGYVVSRCQSLHERPVQTLPSDHMFDEVEPRRNAGTPDWGAP